MSCVSISAASFSIISIFQLLDLCEGGRREGAYASSFVVDITKINPSGKFGPNCQEEEFPSTESSSATDGNCVCAARQAGRGWEVHMLQVCTYVRTRKYFALMMMEH